MALLTLILDLCFQLKKKNTKNTTLTILTMPTLKFSRLAAGPLSFNTILFRRGFLIKAGHTFTRQEKTPPQGDILSDTQALLRFWA